MTLDLHSHLPNETLTRAADLMAQGLGEVFAEAEPEGSQDGDEPPAEAEGS
jgi:hypothetical protein